MARRARFSDFDGVITEEMLSDRQRAILDFIREHVYAKGYPPAVRELVRQWFIFKCQRTHSSA